MPVSGGPYLSAAFFCERVLREQDGVPSFIRVTDRWNINGTNEAMDTTIIQTTLVIALKSGILRSAAQIAITPISPVGDRMLSVFAPVLFEGDDERGVLVIAPLGFPVKEPGLYWWEVALAAQGGDSSVITYIPMRVVYLRTASAMMGANQPPSLGPG